MDELAQRRALREQRKQMADMDEAVESGDPARILDQIAAIDRRSPNTRKRWQVDRDDDGTVCMVWVDKPAGKAAGLWTFEHTADGDGVPIVRVQRSEWDRDGIAAHAVQRWDIFADAHTRTWGGDEKVSLMQAALADLVGWRTAQAAERRLWPSA